jgi:hypothetical protein
MTMVPSRPYQSKITLILGITVGGCLRGQETLVVTSVRGTAILLLLKREVHVGNLHVTRQVWDVAAIIVVSSAVGALVGRVESTCGAVEPIVVSFDRMGRVTAVARVSAASASISAASTPSRILVVV